MGTRIKILSIALGVLLSLSFMPQTSEALLVLCIPPVPSPANPTALADYQKCLKETLPCPSGLTTPLCQEIYLECASGQTDICLKGQNYLKRHATLLPYSQFFPQVGVNLTSETSESTYQTWLKDLAEAKTNWEQKVQEEQKKVATDQQRQRELAEQETANKIREEAEARARAKIKELEERIKVLESQKQAVPAVSSQKTPAPTPVSTVVSPVEQYKQNKSEVDTKGISSIPTHSTSTEDETANLTPPKKTGWFARIVNWFNGR